MLVPPWSLKVAEMVPPLINAIVPVVTTLAPPVTGTETLPLPVHPWRPFPAFVALVRWISLTDGRYGGKFIV